MNEVISYDYIRSKCLQKLSVEMTAAINQGWQPVGGISYDTNARYGNQYIQTMVKYKASQVQEQLDFIAYEIHEINHKTHDS